MSDDEKLNEAIRLLELVRNNHYRHLDDLDNDDVKLDNKIRLFLNGQPDKPFEAGNIRWS